VEQVPCSRERREDGQRVSEESGPRLRRLVSDPLASRIHGTPVGYSLVINPIDYRCDNRRFWFSAHNCQAPTPTSQNLELEQQIRIFGAD
jgi:hypothetical protein